MAVFYRKYRPQKFSDLIGQETIKKSLLSQLENGKISHGYLFAGPRGSGKTSTARILAKAINCRKWDAGDKSKIFYGEPCGKCDACDSITKGSALDLIEIDAASNRGIDEIRDLREKIKNSPVSFRFKVYIIDEAHMLTTEAFNALLKTLEEPPPHAIFILCTTAPNKLPQTIISRLSRLNFQRASQKELLESIEKVAGEEKIKIEADAALLIAKAADGAFRDALSILDQVSAGGKKINSDEAKRFLSIGSWNQTLSFVNFLIANDLKSAIVAVGKMEENGADFALFVKEVISLLEKILFIKIGALELVDEEELEEVKRISETVSFENLQQLIKILLVCEGEMKVYASAKISLILAVCKYCKVDDQTVEDVSEAKSDERIIGVPSTESKPNKKKVVPKSLEEIQPGWDNFLEKVKPVNIHLFALLKSTRPKEFDGANLILEVFYKFHKEKLEEPKIMTMLENFLSEVFESKVALRTVLAKKDVAVPKVVEKSDVVDADALDLDSLAKEIFSK